MLDADANTQTQCPACGRPLHRNGRCYRCASTKYDGGPIATCGDPTPAELEYMERTKAEIRAQHLASLLDPRPLVLPDPFARSGPMPSREELINGTPEPHESPAHPDCPECGAPVHPKNGRCYKCRPGGLTPGGAKDPAVRQQATATPVPRPASTPAAPRPTPAAAAVAGGPGADLFDDLVGAALAVAEAVRGLSPEAARRVLRAVEDRL